MKEITIKNQMDSLIGSTFTNKRAQESYSTAFGEILNNSIGSVNQLQIKADESTKGLASGRQNDIHQTMIAVEKAEVSFELLMQIRNKIISAYESIMRLQV